MEKLQQLYQARTDEVEKAKQIVAKADTESRDLTTEERDAFGKSMQRAEDLGEQIEIRKRLDAASANLDDVEPRIVPPAPVHRQDETRDDGVPPVVDRVKVFKDTRSAYKAGQWIRAQLLGDQRAAQWISDYAPELRVMTGSVNSAGGFLVPTEMEQAIIDNREQYGVFRRILRNVTMSSDTMTVPVRAGGVTAYYVGDAASITASDASWSSVNLNARKIAVLSRMSSELSDDAVISVAEWVASEIGYAFAVAEDNAAVDGDGTSTYGGIQGYRALLDDGTSRTGAVDAASGNDTFSEFTLADITKLMAALPAYALPNARFVCSQAFKGYVLDRLSSAAGGNTIGDLQRGFGPTFFGYPVEISQSMPAGLTTDYSNLVVLLFGDFAKSGILGNRRGVTVATSGDRYFDTDEIAIRGTQRFDIVVHDVGTTTAAGPVVALNGE